MDILYVIGKGSEWNNNELRFSLRSIAKYGKNIDSVFIVGYKPDFVSDEVTFIPCDDPYDCAHKNILHKVLTAIVESDISNHFLISSDDHYYMEPTDFDNLPLYYRSVEIPDRVDGRKLWNPYFRSLHDTRWVLESNKLTIYQTNPHCNTHFFVDLYKKNKHLFDECFRYKFGIELNCLMGNLLIHEGVEPTFFMDAKLNGRESDKEIEERIRECGCLSSTPGIAKSNLAKYLGRVFNNKCKYEK